LLGGRYRSPRLRTPTLLLHGTRDPVLQRAFLRGYERYADDMEIEFVPGASHFIADERPGLVAERARELFGAR
jgi:pimeloyl-ACP methyl ester carboxylesterase